MDIIDYGCLDHNYNSQLLTVSLRGGFGTKSIDILVSIYSLIWDFFGIWDSYKYKNMDKITQILENVVRCKYFEAGVHIKNPIKISYQDGLGRTTQTLDHVVAVHILLWDKRKSQINEYSD